jgi:hypothetical protein
MLRVSVVFVATVAAAFVASQAHADWYFPLVRISCVPEAGFASAETFGLYNIDNNAGRVPTALAAQGIYELRELAGKPVTCQLPHGVLVIEISNYHAPRPTGMCGGVEDADLRVLLDGVEVADARSTHGGCVGSQRHDIRVSRYEVQHCVLRFERPTPIVDSKEFTAVATMCRSVRLY